MKNEIPNPVEVILLNTSAIRQKVENVLGYSSKIQTNHKVKYLVYITFLTSCLIAEVFKYAYCVLYFDQTHDFKIGLN